MRRFCGCRLGSRIGRVLFTFSDAFLTLLGALEGTKTANGPIALHAPMWTCWGIFRSADHGSPPECATNHGRRISFAITAWPKERPPSLGGTR